MRSPAVLKYILVMTFAAAALFVTLISTGGAQPLNLAFCAVVLVLFGIYYYFRLFRSGPKE